MALDYVDPDLSGAIELYAENAGALNNRSDAHQRMRKPAGAVAGADQSFQFDTDYQCT